MSGQKSKKKVGALIKFMEKSMNDKNLSVPEFAKKMKITKRTVYQWLKKDASMNVEKFFRFFEVMDIDIQEFIEQIK